MLNSNLSKKTYTLLRRLREERSSTFNGIHELINKERSDALEIMANADDEKVIFRAQGAAEQLKELSSLFESLEGFEGLFKE